MRKSALASVLLAFAASAAANGGPKSGVAAPPEQEKAPPVIKLEISKSIMSVNYRARASTKVDFQGTALQPRAEGEARVESKKGVLEIDAKFKGLPTAAALGSPYLTYVLWAVTPEGRSTNLGELQVGSGEIKIKVTTRLQSFGMIVTAEPYYAVTFPSEYVVLENVVRSDTSGKIDSVEAKYELFKRSDYESANLPALTMDSKTPLDLYEARNAVRLVKADGADRYAPESFSKAEAALAQAEDYQKRKQKNPVSSAAREAIQMAEDARIITIQRKADEKLAAEKKAAADREAQAQAEAKAAADRAATAREDARAAEEKRRAEEAGRVNAEKQALESQLAAAKEAQKRAEADAARQASEAARQAALARERDAAQQAAEAREAAEKAEREKRELRAKLLEQFNRVLPTTDSDRGLVVNMGDVLFDVGKADLRSNAREALARLAGSVLNYPSLRLSVEGYTDSTGSDEFNQKLSEQRAEAVRSYLQTQGVPAESLSSKGFGKSNPVADNATAAGRQKNRRVEIVVSGEVIGSKIGT